MSVGSGMIVGCAQGISPGRAAARDHRTSSYPPIRRVASTTWSPATASSALMPAKAMKPDLGCVIASHSSPRSCPLRERCTTSKAGRVLTVHPQHVLLAAARRAAADPAWQEEYRRWRPPVERAIAWLVARGNRRVPYRGVLKNDNWLHHRAAALNLRRLVNLGLAHTSDGNWALA